MTSRHGTPPPQASKLASIGVFLAVAALIFSFWARPLAVLLLLAAIALGVVALVRSRGGHPGRGPAFGAIVVSLVAFIIVAATSPATPQPVPVAAPASAPAQPTPTSEVAAPTTTAQQETDVDVDRPYIPAPDTHVNTKVHTGYSGHPCLPGERDGDHDGYCGE
jgi:hypothetical protein